MSASFLVRDRLDQEKIVPWKVDIVDIYLQYWPNDNIITDKDGNVVVDIFNMISPSSLRMFKENPYKNLYFLHLGKQKTIIGIGYKDPKYFEMGDYKRYPTVKHQMELRELELRRFDEEIDGKELSGVSNKIFRRIVHPELYEGFYDDGHIGPNVITEVELLAITTGVA